MDKLFKDFIFSRLNVIQFMDLNGHKYSPETIEQFLNSRGPLDGNSFFFTLKERSDVSKYLETRNKKELINLWIEE